MSLLRTYSKLHSCSYNTIYFKILSSSPSWADYLAMSNNDEHKMPDPEVKSQSVLISGLLVDNTECK